MKIFERNTTEIVYRIVSEVMIGSKKRKKNKKSVWNLLQPQLSVFADTLQTLHWRELS